jgi:hypothetical protein
LLNVDLCENARSTTQSEIKLKKTLWVNEIKGGFLLSVRYPGNEINRGDEIFHPFQSLQRIPKTNG